MKHEKEPDRALRWYIAMQVLRAAALFGGLITIAHVIEKLRGG